MKRISISIDSDYTRIIWGLDHIVLQKKWLTWHRLDGPSVMSYDFTSNIKHINYYLLDASVFLNDLYRLNYHYHENNNNNELSLS